MFSYKTQGQVGRLTVSRMKALRAVDEVERWAARRYDENDESWIILGRSEPSTDKPDVPAVG